MAELAEKLLTFEEFTALSLEGGYELVNGRLEELVAPRPSHAWAGGRMFAEINPYLRTHDPEGFWGVELDIPTLPYHGRRPDFAYYSAADAARGLDMERDRVLGVPTLVVEVVSPEDEQRDQVTKRREYAQVGIPHYWILDPRRRSVLTLVLRGSAYEAAGEFTGKDVLVTDLLPGLRIPLSRLFR
ncbi:MAG TPA: Uma2 family endonuclease [Armatimonadota bacterium]|nr:Uma2 family endonuclease [Armatimonadota bacterium]